MNLSFDVVNNGLIVVSPCEHCLTETFTNKFELEGAETRASSLAAGQEEIAQTTREEFGIGVVDSWAERDELSRAQEAGEDDGNAPKKMFGGDE